MTLSAISRTGRRGSGTSAARPLTAAGAACTIAIVIVLSALVAAPSRLGAQVLRNPETPYHFLRYDDVPEDQQNPAWPDDFWAPLKFIPLDIAPGSYINFGGEDRERVEHFNNVFFGLTPQRNLTYDLHRLLFEADLHIGDTFRTFLQFGDHLVTSHSYSPPTDVDRLDLQQGFIDVKAPVGQDSSLTVRGGRQEITFGSARLVDVREGPNIRLSFDGGRLIYQSPDLRLDAFVTKPVIPERGYFDDSTDPRQSFWGLYGVMPVPAVPGLNVDFYYLGLDRQNAVFAQEPPTRRVSRWERASGADPARGTMTPRASFNSERSGPATSGRGPRLPTPATRSTTTGASRGWGCRLTSQVAVAPAGRSGLSTPYSPNSPTLLRRRSTRQSTSSTRFPRLLSSRPTISP
jgi:hypothetical protein